jgi:S1-C subfamily serine protease
MITQDELFDKYIKGELDENGKIAFELRLQSDAEFKNRFEEHAAAAKFFNDYHNEKEFLNRFKQIENKYHQDIIPLRTSYEKSGILQNLLMYLKVASVAAVTSLAVFILSWKIFFKSRIPSQEITNLKLQIHGLKYSQKALQNKINEKSVSDKMTEIPVFQGTGFFVNNEGLILTGYHVIQNADSVFISGPSMGTVKAELVAKDSLLDMALLMIPKECIKEKVSVTLLNNVSSLGEKVFTLGYPGTEQVYGEGSLSALNGFNGDTTLYQISVPLNPGNSGGPLWDQSGKLIGMIRGKNFAKEGNAYAVKSVYVADFLKKSGAKGVVYSRNSEGNVNIKHFLKKNTSAVVQVHAWQKLKTD